MSDGLAEPPEGYPDWPYVEPPLPLTELREERSLLSGRFEFTDRRGFEHHINFGNTVNAKTKVVASICELRIEGGQVVPFQGGSSMEVHNVVPRANGVVIVRGYIHAERNVPCRLNFLWDG